MAAAWAAGGWRGLFSHSQKGLADWATLLYIYRQMKEHAQGDPAARLRQRKYALAQRFGLPADLLPGSLSRRLTRCGKPTCRCAGGEGHEAWSLTFMVAAKKRVLHIPKELVEDVRKRVDAGHEFQEAVREVLAANAELLALERKQRRRKR